MSECDGCAARAAALHRRARAGSTAMTYNDDVPAAEVTAPRACRGVRKVRTAQGTVLDNVQAGQPDGKCNRKIPLEEGVSGKGRGASEGMVVRARPDPSPLTPFSSKGEMVR